MRAAFLANIKPAAAGGGGVVTWQSSGTVDIQGGDTTATMPAYPSSIAVGDLLLCFVGIKPSVANSGSISSFPHYTLLDSHTGGGYGGTLGVQSGNTHLFVYYRIADGTANDTPASGPTYVNNSIAWAVVHRLSKSGGTWNLATAKGENTVGGNPFTVVHTSDPGVPSGDFIIQAVSAAGQNAGITFSAQTLSQSGVTFGTVTERNEPTSNSGNQVGGCIWTAHATAGTSAGNPTASATISTFTSGQQGPGIFTRIRAA
jgi:hypothetical protein